MDILTQAAENIVKEQQNIIGPLAISEAKKVDGIKFDDSSHVMPLQGDEKAVLEKLVKKYESIFGKASIEICKDAIKQLNVPKDQLPTLLH